jgi:hypothetical protein
MRKTFISAVLLSMLTVSALAAPGGASETAKGHSAAVKATANDPARVKGAGGISGVAKGHGAKVSGSVKKAPKTPEAPEAPADL